MPLFRCCLPERLRLLLHYISFVIAVFSTSACTLDAKLTDLIGASSDSVNQRIPIFFIESPNKTSMISEAGNVNLTMLANPDIYQEMYITNESSCEGGGSWEPYQTSKLNWQLNSQQENSTASIYVKFRNTTGTNISDCISDTITWIKPESFNLCGATTSSALTYGKLFDSGGNTAGYGNNESCTFTITSSSDIHLTFESMSLQESDVLKVYDGDTNSGTLLYSFNANYASINPSTLIANSGSLTIQFVSDSTNTMDGFAATWSSVTRELSTLKINNDNSYAPTASVTVHSGENFGLAEMYFTNDATCLTGGSWETLALSKTWNLTSEIDGSKNVYVKYRDVYQQETTCEMTSVVLDRSPPSSPVITYFSPFSSLDASPNILFIPGIDNESGIDHYEVRILKSSDSTVVKDWTIISTNDARLPLLSLNSLNLTANEFYSPQVKAVNKAGLESTVATTTLSWQPKASLAIAFGNNASGAVGVDSDDPRFPALTPNQVVGGRSFSQVSAGYNYSCGIESNSKKSYCWGNNKYGQLGDNSTLQRESPVPVSGVNGGSAIDFTQIKVGGEPSAVFTCGLEEVTKKAYCWGSNLNGRLGNNSTFQSLTPTPVLGVAGGPAISFDDLTLGTAHACGIEAITQKAYCWGYNGNGQLGNNTAVDSLTPVEVLGIGGGAFINFTQIVAGNQFTCAIEALTQKAYCWGFNSGGRLGDGTQTASRTPVAVLGVSGGPAKSFSKITTNAFSAHVCAIEAGTQAAFCWGNNPDGNLGDNTTTDRLTPVAVLGVGGLPPALSFFDLSVGNSLTCGLEAGTKKAYCWGDYSNGRLGNYAISVQKAPTAVLGIDGGPAKDFIQIGTGQDHTCAIEALTFNAYCWGSNIDGQIGNSSSTNVKLPASVIGIAGTPIKFAQIDIGQSHSCGIEELTQKAYCWGSNGTGQIGIGTQTAVGKPTAVLGVAGGASLAFSQISVGNSHTCAIEIGTEEAYCWGGNPFGELGDNTQIARSTPVKVKGVGGGIAIKFNQLSAGSGFTCGLEVGTNKAYCWGFNFYHQLGNGSANMQILTPVAVSGVGGAASLQYSQISSGSIHACALETGTQKAYCWGSGAFGRLGNNLSADNGFPVAVLGVNAGASLSFTHISTGHYHSCAIEALTKKAYCWGYNIKGQVGDGSISTIYNTPVAVIGPSGGAAINFSQIESGKEHTCGIEDFTNNLYCWGSNQYGQLGNNAVVQSQIPYPSSLGMTFSSISVDGHSTLGLIY